MLKLSLKILIISCLLPLTQVAAQTEVYSGEYVITPSLQAAGNSNWLEDKLSQHKSTKIKSLGSNNSLIQKNSTKTLGLARQSAREIVLFDPNDDFCSELKASGFVRNCSPNFVYRASKVSNDPNLSDSWGLGAIDAFSSWDIETTSDIVVAVIDTGIDFNHPDLRDNIWVNTGEIPANGLDDDANGYIDDIHGISSFGGSPLDNNGHGTHVAGIIGAKGNNGLGSSGVLWQVELMALKFLDAGGAGALSGAIEMINYMVSMKNQGVNLRVANNSWGGLGFSESLAQAISDAEQAGIIMVAAAGNISNNNDSLPFYPAALSNSNIVSVAALDEDFNLASFSNYGEQTVDIAAPGTAIFSTIVGNAYKSMGGTSMASPFVSGALALVMQTNPSLGNSAAIDQLYQTANWLPGLFGVTKTGKYLNLNALVRNIRNDINIPSSGEPENCNYQIQEIAYSEPVAVKASAIILQEDEFNHKTVSLPFLFPYFDQKIGTLRISPNGVLYAGDAPTGLDYKNQDSAPINSIAALHTDLQASANPHGVRVKTEGDHMTVYWRGQYYRSEDLGDIEVFAKLFSDGDIEVHISIANNTLLKRVRGASTIGIAGDLASQSLTYAKNSKKLRNKTAVRFSRVCTQSDTATIKRFKIKKKNKRSSNKSLKPREKLNIQVNSTSSQTLALRATLDGQLCPSSLPISLASGKNKFKARIPQSFKHHKKLKLTLGDKRQRISISGKKSKKTKDIASRCQALYSSIN